MKFFGIATALFGALVTVTSAAPAFMADDPDTTKFYITAPLENNVYSAGGVVTTEWINGVPGPFKLELLKGSNAASMQNTGVPFKNTEGSTGSYKWQVPSDVPAGTYAFHYVFNGGESYSPQFKITSGSASSSNQAQQHTESAPTRVTSDNATTGLGVRPNSGASTSTPPNSTTNTRAQTPPQSASGATTGSRSSSALPGTANRVPQQQASQQRQPAQNEVSAMN
ncbi:Flavin-linked sulfhydryl oxidase of the mitochondrial IMS [Mucor velutinosus]|uniref:Flavin-linked sulfhydryl oxidase of the mitochondrial IMS n=1 Tax=Mucor velutinosus TaxID=708070 RepID=A0AAN7DQ45_9FUNG|nr:Flavin-linked sulfhydryl oxidase of the mitochondrial IMS [Mucor velutinosus]